MINKTSIYRRQLEWLNSTLEYLKRGELISKYIANNRDSILDLFYKDINMLKDEFVVMFPVDKLGNVSGTMHFLKLVSGGGGDQYSSNGSIMSKANLETNLKEIIKLMKAYINYKSEFTIFYSWQSDLPNNINRGVIGTQLKKAIKELNEENNDIKLTLDQDTRNEPGSPDIVNAIMHKIDSCLGFVADITPITKKNNKEISNPNVMLETGYAFSSISDERVLLICNTASCDVKNIPFDLGLKRLICYELKGNESETEIQRIKNDLKNKIKVGLKAIREL